jgi:hypothetical protein
MQSLSSSAWLELAADIHDMPVTPARNAKLVWALGDGLRLEHIIHIVDTFAKNLSLLAPRCLQIGCAFDRGSRLDSLCLG